MGTDIISVIVILAAVVLYCIKKIPIWITSLLVMVVMVWTGCIDFATAYSGFSNRVMFLIAGMAIIGQACVDTGLANRIGNALAKLVGDSEKKAVFMVLVVATAMGAFLNGALVVAILMPIIDCIVVQSGGKITRKATYFPLGIMATIGNGLTAVSASSMITCAGILTNAGYREIAFFEPMKIALPATVAVIVFYMLIGYRLSKKWFDFPEVPISGDVTIDMNDKSKYPIWKQVVTGVTLLGVIVALVAGGNFGAWPIIGSIIVVLTGCVSEKNALKSVSWSTIITVGAAIGFSGALDATGGGQLIANFFTKIAGPFGESAFGMSVIMLIISALLSAALSDNATVAATVPIALAISQANAWDPIPIVIAIACGLKICQFMTPICTSCVTQTIGAGYRAKDYAKLGTLMSLVAGVVVVAMIGIVY